MAVTIRPDQEEALLRVASYHRRDPVLVVIRSPPLEHTPVLPSLSEAFPTPPTAHLGILKRLPVEVLSTICLHMDMLSCFRFRQVNRIARDIVSSTVEYRAVASHGIEGFRALLRTGVGTHFSLYDLHRTLHAEECTTCGGFGAFLFLPTTQRCCYNCLEYARDLSVGTLASFSKASKISQPQLRRLLPVLHAIPGVYSMELKTHRSRLHLIAWKAAIESLASADLSPRIPLKLARTDGIDLRCMVTTAFPHLNRATGEVQHGVSCKGCQVVMARTRNKTLEHYENRDRAYSKQGFLHHFPLCAEAQKLWAASREGTAAFDEPEFTRRGGFLFEYDAYGYPR